MTVTRMATRGPIPVTVDTFEASGGTGAGRIPWGGGNAERRRIYSPQKSLCIPLRRPLKGPYDLGPWNF